MAKYADPFLSRLGATEGRARSIQSWATRLSSSVPCKAGSSNGGAVFFGTVKRIAKGIRPSLLSEIDAVAFRLSLSSPSETSLTIYPRSSQTSPSFPSSPPLKFSDLRRYGSPVQHYAAKVKTLLLDGVPATLDRPTYAIIDSGCTGLLLSESMYSQGKFNAPPAVLRTPRSVTVEFENDLKLTAGGKGKGRSSFLALPVPIPWFGERGVARPETAPIHVMSLGLAFFNSSDVIIDTEQMRGWIT
ncbi:hypothetical protein TrVE_jg2655 [Triparma verrucosa]|uniref:Uncharacterized protein n=1 Tax=Triparma verrucosa TaxID=1606542 RepID=A0A9W7ER81_9STRA|nr:hypothetical protein TrVE_jg2655 [Triparma verrucosa]